MLLVLLRPADLSGAAEHAEGHRRWLQAGLASGEIFLVGGLRAGGGMFVSHGDNADDLARRLADDPVVAHGVVTPDIIEFELTMNDPRLAFLAAGASEA
jgi:uncharacterized protein YciI